MDIYHYDRETGELLGTGKADPDPLDAGNWLIPANATAIAPPTQDQGKTRVFEDGVWKLTNEPVEADPTSADPAQPELPADPVQALRTFLKANPDVLALVLKGMK